jgi:SAM-dependent methyltransferase
LFSQRYKVIATNIYPKNLVDYICSVNCLPFEDGRFGGVICEHVLEHLEEPAKAIEEISRVLKPKGLLILIVPFSWPLHDKPYDLWRFTEEGLRALLMKRFEQIRFETIGEPNKPNLICLTARKPAYKKQKKKSPRVSVIMPTYNRARMIGKSIDSVLNQTFKDWELIVISDGSTDNTRQVVRRYKDPRIIFLEKENAGPASARNYGLRHARGEYIAYCDDDDEILPYHLQTMVNYLDRHPEVGLVRGDGVTFKGKQKQGYFKIGFLWATMHRRDNAKRAGLFDKRLLTGEDERIALLP